jgi:hypothetical protein
MHCNKPDEGVDGPVLTKRYSPSAAPRLGGGTVVLTPVFNAISAAQTDATVAADYHA